MMRGCKIISRSATGKRRRRPAEPLKVEVKFIQTEEASERWNRIFELLETEDTERNNHSNEEPYDSGPVQLTLF
jgi:hypothetical protein